jgi:BON domain
MKLSDLKATAIGAAIGAAAAVLFDRTSGRRRRAMARDRTTGVVRRGWKRAAREGRGVAAQGYGLTQRAAHLREQPKDHDDVTLARKVETVIFRPTDSPKGTVDVNVVDGVAYLRGEVPDQETVDRLVSDAAGVGGIRSVENLLHLPGRPVPAG